MLTFSRILLSMSASTSALHEPSAATANPNRPIKRHLKGNVGCVTVVEVVDAKGESSLDQNMGNSQSSECRRWVCLKMGFIWFINNWWTFFRGNMMNCGIYIWIYCERQGQWLPRIDSTFLIDRAPTLGGRKNGGGVLKIRVQWENVSQMPAGFLLMNSLKK